MFAKILCNPEVDTIININKSSEISMEQTTNNILKKCEQQKETTQLSGDKLKILIDKNT